MNRVNLARLSLPTRGLLGTSAAALGLLLAGCSSGGGDSTGTVKTGGDFVVLGTSPTNNGTLFLNDAVHVDFSNPVNLDSANLLTYSFRVRDQIGQQVNEPVPGVFVLGRSPGDAEAGRRLSFVPRLPTNDAYTNGSFRPGRQYEVSLVGGDRVTGTVLRDQNNRGLKEPVTFRFSTSDGGTPADLFRNVAAGGPRRVGFQITPTPDAPGTTAPDGPGVALNKLGAPPVEIRLLFDQPLNPSSLNVPVSVDTDPVTRSEATRGRIYLEYDDVELGERVWIPADVDLERNAVDGATVVLRPVGVLPNNATVRVVVLDTLEDISGESNQNNPTYVETFGSFRTKRSYNQLFDGVVEDFTTTAAVDFAAAFNEPVAEAGPGFVKAGFGFEGTATNLEFEPEVAETILNTNFTSVQPKGGGSPYNVSGGVFNFKNVTIGLGKIVRGQGSNPMVWLVSGKMEIAGTLTVRGGNGERITTTGDANVPKAGGPGSCGGGDGGAGSPSATVRDLKGSTGNGPGNVPLQGGLGGSLACTAGCVRGSGGGGGAMATQGDPNYRVKFVPAGTTGNVQPIFGQQVGIGGFGCAGAAGTATRTLNGGDAGPVVFTDARSDNNFWGSGIDRARKLRITGELAVPVGGGGGGGGGDLSFNANCNIDDPSFGNDSSGGGGGGGGGVLIVKALGPIIIQSSGSISADGGHGGGGEGGGVSTKSGGGGGGAGGMVVLMSATRIEINARGTGTSFTYGDRNYDFSVSADGGVCVTAEESAVSGPPPFVRKKYPANGSEPMAATAYDAAPLGGFGGMGVVQLMVPPGPLAPPEPADNTNTVFDDNIRVFRGGVPQTGLDKQRLLAWRGYPNQFGQSVDDNGTVFPTPIGDNEGDIRPSPILLPVPFASKSRLRSKWIDTGATKRRPLVDDNDTARGIVTSGGVAVPGPWYEFAGLDPATGYAAYTVQASLGRVNHPAIGTPTPILTKTDTATFLGRPAYRVELTVDLPVPAGDAVADRFSQYEAELLDANNVVVGSFRVLSHTSRQLLLSPDSGALPASATKVQLRAKFFRLVTNGAEGLGATYLGNDGSRVPIANVRIGFAFHQNPGSASAVRFPAAADEFVYNLSDPLVQEQVRALGAPFVQWDILFDGQFKKNTADVPTALGPDTPRPELHFLRLPFRF